METATMGKVLVTATIENLRDLYGAEQGTVAQEQVRRVSVTNALVDTGATGLALPKPLIEQLGLKSYRKRRVRTSLGFGETMMYEAVRLTVQGRDCTVDVSESPEGNP